MKARRAEADGAEKKSGRASWACETTNAYRTTRGASASPKCLVEGRSLSRARVGKPLVCFSYLLIPGRYLCYHFTGGDYCRYNQQANK